MVIENPDGTSKLPGASYYWFFAIAMLVTSVLFIPVALGTSPRVHPEKPRLITRVTHCGFYSTLSPFYVKFTSIPRSDG